MSRIESIKDLPEDVIKEWRDELKRFPEIAELEAKRMTLIRMRRYADAVRMKNEIEKLEDEIINRLLREYEGERVRLEEMFKGMSNDERTQINILSTAIVMCCDMLETFVMDCDEIIKRTNDGATVVMYDKLIKVGREAKQQMDMMAREADILFQYKVADGCDDVTQLVYNKAKSVLNKYLKQKNKEKEVKDGKGMAVGN